MTRWRAFCETVHIVALALWLGAAVSAGAQAAAAFPLMKSLDPRLPAFSHYTGEHWLIAGGKIAQRGFLVADVVQFPAALLAFGTLGWMIAARTLAPHRASTIVRSLALAIALAAFASLLLIVTPRFNTALTAYWQAALAGDNASTATHKAAVDELHPMLSNLMGVMAASVFIALIAGIRSALTTGAPEPIVPGRK